MMKKSFKNRSAVSPVIATILMVAITVVLAAVLYVMVMGFGGTTPTAPTASMVNDSAQNRVVITISPATDFDDLKFGFVGGTTMDMDDAETATGTNINATFMDLGADGKVTTGDYFLITGTGSGTLTLLWKSGDTTQSIASVTV